MVRLVPLIVLITATMGCASFQTGEIAGFGDTEVTIEGPPDTPIDVYKNGALVTSNLINRPFVHIQPWHDTSDTLYEVITRIDALPAKKVQFICKGQKRELTDDPKRYILKIKTDGSGTLTEK